ncbi:hypothetical protein I0C86_11730 [Plantactinospora sp. S1510]|uniref:Mce-associated membrane protein n=1 Tax=Plantactinospora alkalitolerans TaxID=2789879 RepID=A0ABS0GTV6_9ACTN|nr:hypothetical protein [Plantactinospora alkalitolerans]MBF9129628.1 hypothetical protein [Plantactinospora alkalitolerans]
MPTGEERRLKLVKATPTVEPTSGGDDREPIPVEAGAPGGGVRPSARRRRQPARRTVTRRLPESGDPVESILERLDQEPVDAGGRPVDPDGQPVDADGQPVDADGQPVDPDRGAAVGTDSAGEAPTAGPDAPERRPGTTIALAAALCVTLALAGFLGYQRYQDRAVEQARAQALAAARQTTVNFVSVSASSVDSDLQRITAGAAGEFKEEFTRGQAQVRAAVIENKVESTGTVLRAGLVSGDLRAAVALVAVDATVKNVHAPDGRAAHYRIQVDLTRDRDSGAWLVSRLQFVG